MNKLNKNEQIYMKKTLTSCEREKTDRNNNNHIID